MRSSRWARGLLKAFYEGIDLTGFEVVDVELPLTARLYTEDGQPTDLMVNGHFGCGAQGCRRQHRRRGQQDLQESLCAADRGRGPSTFQSYAYLLASNRYVPSHQLTSIAVSM